MPSAGGDRTLAQEGEYQPERGDLGGNPAQVGGHDAQAGQYLHRAVVARPVVVADGGQIHAVEFAGEEQSHQDQAQAGAERVGHHAAQAFLGESGRDAEHGFRAEPGGEHRRGDHRQRQAAARDGVIPGVVDTGSGVETDADGNQQVDDDEPDQHD